MRRRSTGPVRGKAQYTITGPGGRGASGSSPPLKSDSEERGAARLAAEVDALRRELTNVTAEHHRQIAELESAISANEQMVRTLSGALAVERERASRGREGIRDGVGELVRKFIVKIVSVPAARGPLLGMILRETEIWWIRRRARWLFDKKYYLARNPDVARAGVDPVRHYVEHGGGEGRNPCLYFDTSYYLWKSEHLPSGSLSPLGHFLLLGKRHLVSPTPWFDYGWYLSRNGDVALAAVEPFWHFVNHGLAENRSSCEGFDPQFYLRNHPEMAGRGVPALEHFLRAQQPEEESQPEAVTADYDGPDYPDDFEQAILALPSRGDRSPLLDVVVPVYRGLQETLSCLWHVLKARNDTAFELVVVDDCSPEPGLSEVLARLAEAQCFTLIRNETNSGFVKSVNAGMKLHPDRDAILLNSDTEVYGDWIDRLRRTASIRPDCSTVTPLTNNGTICSYPRFVHDNPTPLDVPYEELDALAAQVNRGGAVVAPTAVGFCMYIKRQAIERVGYFDEEAFGTGYGEENDFCLRAQNAGYVDLIATDVFVRHFGSMSFLGQKAERVQNALKVITKRYPQYRADVAAFVKADELRGHRARLDLARLQRQSRDRSVLIVSHVRGGGTEQHVREEIERLTERGISVYRMSTGEAGGTRVRHSHSQGAELPNLDACDLRDDADRIVELWRDLRIGEVHLHHLADFGADAAALMFDLLGRAALPWRVVVHDYASICPRMTLTYGSGAYCGEPDEAGCAWCLRQMGSETGTEDILGWRQAYRMLFHGAAEVTVPDEDVSDRLRRYFPEARFNVRPHETISVAQSGPPAPLGGRNLRVAVLGAISTIKGFETLLACARDARSRELAIEFTVIGFTKDDPAARRAGIRISGEYNTETFGKYMRDCEPDVIFFPGVCPETYSYTLSRAFEHGRPIMAFDIGAIARRLRAQSRPEDVLLPMGTTPAEINDALLERIPAGPAGSTELREKDGAGSAALS